MALRALLALAFAAAACAAPVSVDPAPTGTAPPPVTAASQLGHVAGSFAAGRGQRHAPRAHRDDG